MRRKDREVTELNAIKEMLDTANILVLGLVEDNQAYMIPLNFGLSCENQIITIYYHAAKEGRKLDILATNDQVSFLVYQDLTVKMLENGEQATNYYKSVMGTGINQEVIDLTEKRAIVKLLLERYEYTGDQDVPDRAINNTYIGKITVNSISGKANLPGSQTHD